MLVNRPSRSAATTTMMVESRSSARVGQAAFFSSSIISTKKMRVLRNGFFMAGTGRRGGNRIPNQRFWRPLLYQLSYAPVGRVGWKGLRRRSRGPGRDLGDAHGKVFAARAYSMISTMRPA